MRPEEPPDTPFGEDITHPDSRTIPRAFHGEWVRDLSDGHSPRTVLSSDQVVIGNDVQRVVAVRFIDTDKIAVVSLPTGTDQKKYSLFYFGLSEDGNSLIDLENEDWVLHRLRG
jgi:hypothetical protein